MLYELAALKHAFDGTNMCALILKILRGKFQALSEEYSKELRALVNSMLQPVVCDNVCMYHQCRTFYPRVHGRMHARNGLACRAHVTPARLQASSYLGEAFAVDQPFSLTLLFDAIWRFCTIGGCLHCLCVCMYVCMAFALLLQPADRPSVTEVLSTPIIQRALRISAAREEKLGTRHLKHALPILSVRAH